MPHEVARESARGDFRRTLCQIHSSETGNYSHPPRMVHRLQTSCRSSRRNSRLCDWHREACRRSSVTAVTPSKPCTAYAATPCPGRAEFTPVYGILYRLKHSAVKSYVAQVFSLTATLVSPRRETLSNRSFPSKGLWSPFLVGFGTCVAPTTNPSASLLAIGVECIPPSPRRVI